MYAKVLFKRGDVVRMTFTNRSQLFVVVSTHDPEFPQCMRVVSLDGEHHSPIVFRMPQAYFAMVRNGNKTTKYQLPEEVQ